jgi:hypothetical protein
MRRPSFFSSIPAERREIERIAGPRLGRLFIPRPGTATYDCVFVFKRPAVVLSNQLRSAIEKHASAGQRILVIGPDFTVEARSLAVEAGCEITCEREFGWTDASWHEHLRHEP